jgi:hypothetical protein
MVNEVGSILSFPVEPPRASIHLPIGLAPGGQVGKGRAEQPESGSGVRAVVSGLHAQIRLAKDAMADAALQIRLTQSHLEMADDVLAQAKANLTQIVKQYPPFAQDSPQRIAYLNAITGLRKQLEALSFPMVREQEGLEPGQAKGIDWQEVLPPLPLLPKQGDLSIPELAPEMATDSDVASALGAVVRTQERVSLMKQGMWDEVARFVGSLDVSRAISQAGEVKAYVASTPGHGLSVAGSQLMANSI